MLDALNQLDDKDHGRLLGWLPEHPFKGALKLIVSTLPGDTMEVMEKRAWPTLQIQPLTRVATILNNLGSLLKNINRLAEAEQLMKRSVEILIIFTRTTGQQHPHLKISVKNYIKLLQTIGRSKVQIETQLKKMGLEFF